MLSEVVDANEVQDEPLPLVPLLQRGPTGWFGQGQNYRIVDNVIKIKVTDASLDHGPSELQRLRVMDDQGNFSQHVRVDRNDDLYKLWTSKIGPYLADWVLGKGRNASPSWTLLKFPEGYTLWLHKTGVNTDPANPRIDAYLHGAPHLGPSTTANRTTLAPTVFRSPMEFVEHAIWLMKGRQGQCLCKYCTPGQSQRAINARLNRGLETDSDPETDEDGVEGGVAGVVASASGTGTGYRVRGRGAFIRANRGRRARRDKSPPIMAKDYRVLDGGAGPA